MTSPSPVPPPARHKWDHRDRHNASCARCGTTAQRRPDPHGQRWFTEWRLPDGSYVNNYGGGKTPPCEPAMTGKSPQIVTAV